MVDVLMRGVPALRIALASVAKTHDELIVLARAVRSRAPRDLEAVWEAVNAHLVAAEQLEAHVRLMIAVNSAPPAPLTEDVTVLS